MISRSTIAAAARVIEYAAARPIALSADLIPPSKGAAEGVETGNAKDKAHGLVLSQPVGVDFYCIAQALEFVGADVGAGSLKNA